MSSRVESRRRSGQSWGFRRDGNGTANDVGCGRRGCFVGASAEALECATSAKLRPAGVAEGESNVWMPIALAGGGVFRDGLPRATALCGKGTKLVSALKVAVARGNPR